MGMPHGSPVPQNARMRLARCPTERVIRSNPRCLSCRIRISKIGRSPIGTSGLGTVTVKGRNRLPLPPARITARIALLSNPVEARVVRGGMGQEVVAHLLEARFEAEGRRIAERGGGA